MSDTLRFPTTAPTKNLPSEANQIITLAAATNTFPQGGSGAFVSIADWKQIAAGSEVPYIDIVIEFQYAGDGSPSSFQIGDGTTVTTLGLFGQIDKPYPKGSPMGAAPRQFLLGRLGLTQGTVAPTIPIISPTCGWAQEVCNVGVYDRLAIGGINTVVSAPEAYTINVTARPIRRRFYAG